MSRKVPASDFREGMISKRLQSVKMVILILSGKGGVGKSIVSAALAAILEGVGFAVGLMDADIYGPSSALLFDTCSRPREGKRGLIPPVARGVRIMSVDLLAPGRPIPLTGEGARQVVKEMLALTYWGDLDYLIVDMPPATSDIMMIFTSLAKKEIAAFVVTMPDKLSLMVAHRVLQLLDSGRVPIAGVLGNMHRAGRRAGAVDDDGARRLAKEFNVAFLGKLPYDLDVLSATEKGDIKALLRTRFAEALRQSVGAYFHWIHDSQS
jgi:ATP-binding protein involved in chromosome partitioning